MAKARKKSCAASRGTVRAKTLKYCVTGKNGIILSCHHTKKLALAKQRKTLGQKIIKNRKRCPISRPGCR